MNNQNINFVLTGQIKNKNNLLRTIFNLKKCSFINEIILSTWSEEIDRNKRLFSFLERQKIKIVTEKSPDFDIPYFYQVKSFENAINAIDDNTLKIFKSRTDLFISQKYIKKIINLDYKLTTKSIFSEKIWIPFFEISKPFYIGDECFYASYKDSKLLINYETKYDKWDIGPGRSHVRRFLNPYIEKLDKIEKFQALFSKTNHGSELRFQTLKILLNNKDFLDYLFFYYMIILNDFRVGLEGLKSYIKFREWSSGFTQPNQSSFYESFNQSNSFNPSLGQIFSYDEIWINKMAQNSDITEKLLSNKLYKSYINTL
jgi:hypothetical protein